MLLYGQNMGRNVKEKLTSVPLEPVLQKTGYAMCSPLEDQSALMILDPPRYWTDLFIQ